MNGRCMLEQIHEFWGRSISNGRESTKREMAWSFLLAKKYESETFFLKQYDFAKCVFDACPHTIKP